LAACSSGKSTLDAGNDDTTPATTTVAPTTGSSDSTAAGPTEPATTAVTEPPPTTEAAVLADLPACPVDALDAVTGTTDITFWHAMTNNNETVLQQITDAYNSSQSKVHVNLANQNGYNEMIDKYTQSSQGSRPNMAQLPEYALQLMVDSDSVVPAQACAEADGFDMSDFVPRAIGAYSTQGVLWGTPFNISSPVLFYRKSMFETAGIDPADPPTTLDAVREDSQKIVDSGAASFGIALESGVDSGGGWFLEQWLAKQGQFYADNENGRAAPATKVLYGNPQTVDLLTQVQSLVTDGLAAYVGDNASGQDQLLKLADPAAPAAMTIASSASLGTVITTLDGGFIPGTDSTDLGIGPMPGPGAPGALVGGAALYIMADKGDAQVAATWDFIKYLTSAQTQSTWAAATGYAPVVQSAATLDPLATTYATDPRFKVALDQLNVAVDAPSSLGPVLGPMREVRIVAQKLTDTVLSGGDVAAAVTDAATQADNIITDYNANNGTGG
jgi:sn-glycerol 3-phosphate transport system substrate-binding protein